MKLELKTIYCYILQYLTGDYDFKFELIINGWFNL